MITYVGASSPNGARSINGYGIASYSSSGSPTHLVVKPVASNPMMAGNPAQRNMMRLPANPPRSLPQPPRSLPMPPTYRWALWLIYVMRLSKKGQWTLHVYGNFDTLWLKWVQMTFYQSNKSTEVIWDNFELFKSWGNKISYTIIMQLTVLFCGVLDALVNFGETQLTVVNQSDKLCL